jgi:hypothetical protein
MSIMSFRTEAAQAVSAKLKQSSGKIQRVKIGNRMRPGAAPLGPASRPILPPRPVIRRCE